MLPVKKDAEGNYTDRRFCVDYRPINEATAPDKYGLHRPDQIFREIKGQKILSKIDLRAGFHQILSERRTSQKLLSGGTTKFGSM